MASLPTLLQTPQPGTSHPSTALHLLPVHIAYSGPARVANYFPIISTGHNLYKSYFRGRLLVGVEIPLSEGYAGQVWKSNAPSVSNSSSRASTSKSITKDDTTTSTDYPSADYSASSPRRSPRKRASTSTIDASSSSTVTGKAGNSIAKGKKRPPPKRQRFAMSPDISPVKETASHDATMAFEEALDKAAETLDDTIADKTNEVEDSESSQEVTVTSPAKKRAKLEAGAEGLAEEMKMEEDGNVTVTMTAESTTTTLQAGGETITSTTVKLERTVTPPPPSSAPTTVPSTPMSASSNNLPINIISPQTPRTPKSTAFSSYREMSEYDDPSAEDATNNERIHQRLIQQVGAFDKVTIWNPDIELDKGDDCYVRSLTEWTVLSDLHLCQEGMMI